MQITTLNKIINIFLIGAFAFILLLFPLYFYNYEYFNKLNLAELNKLISNLGATTITLIIAFIFISIPMLLGVVIDAASNSIFENIVEKLPKKPIARMFFRITWRYNQCNDLGGKCKDKIKLSDKYRHLAEDENLIRSYAVAVFLHTANKENIEWVIQHYSYYLLSINYLFICCLIFIFTFFLPFNLFTKPIVLLICGTFIYLLMNQAMSKFLYSYECAYRHWLVILAEESGEKPTTAKTRQSKKAETPNK